MTSKEQEGAEIANLLMQTTDKKPTLAHEQTGNSPSDLSESEEMEEEEEEDEEALAAVMNATAGTADSLPAPARAAAPVAAAPAVAAAAPAAAAPTPVAAPAAAPVAAAPAVAAAAPAAAAPTPVAAPAAAPVAAAAAPTTPSGNGINYAELAHQIDYSRIYIDPTKARVDTEAVAKHLDISRLAEHVVKLMPAPAPPVLTPPPAPKRVVVPINPQKPPTPTAETPKEEEEKQEIKPDAPAERKFFAPAGMRPVKPPQVNTWDGAKVDASKDEKTEVDAEVKDRVEEPDSWLAWVSYGLLGLLLLGLVVLGMMDHLSDPVDQNSDQSDNETTLVATPEATPIAPATSTNAGQSTCIPRIDLARAPSSRAARLQLNCGQDVVCEAGITYDTRETTDADGNKWLDLRGRPNASNRGDRIGCALQ